MLIIMLGCSMILNGSLTDKEGKRRMKKRKVYKVLYKHYRGRSDVLQREVNRLHAVLKKHGISAVPEGNE